MVRPVVKLRRKKLWVTGLILLVVLAGGACSVPLVRAGLRSTGGFVALPGDERVRYEPGAEPQAAILARALPGAIATVEDKQGWAFAAPVSVHVCATMESARAFGGFGPTGDPAGFVLNGQLFITPKRTNTPERLPRILAHELSHLHLGRALGKWRFTFGLPFWFKEGLAVQVSGGGGAEPVSVEQARQALREGRALVPRERDGFHRSFFPDHDGLPVFLFYRQSGMFVGYLRARDEAAFRRVLMELKNGASFAQAVQSGYGQDTAGLWTEFVRQVAPK